MASKRVVIQGTMYFNEEHVDNSLPGGGLYPDNSLPGGGLYPDNSLPLNPRPDHPIVIPPGYISQPIVIPPCGGTKPGGVPTHPIVLPPNFPSHPIVIPDDPPRVEIWPPLGKPDNSLPTNPKPDNSLPDEPVAMPKYTLVFSMLKGWALVQLKEK
jgi:hypothetical protein